MTQFAQALHDRVSVLFRGSATVEKRALRAGFVARSGGAPREQNPYARPSGPPHLELRSDELEDLLLDRWQSGWDQADAELA